MLKTTTSILTSGIALAMAMWVGSSAAALPLVYGPMAMGPANSGPANAAEHCSQLLHRARQAMAENDLEAAETLLVQAEKLDVRPNPLDLLSDTPARVRRDLERKREAASNPTLPSQRFSPMHLLTGNTERSTPADPFTARKPGEVPEQLSDSKGRARSYLDRGRAELAKNNLPAATHWYHQAAKLNATFSPQEDSPAKLAAAIREQGGTIAPPPTDAGRTAQAAPPQQEPASPVRSLPKPPPRVDSASAEGLMALGGPPRDDQVRLPGALDGMRPATADGDADTRAQSNNLLVQARLALAVGDVRRAMQFTDQANQLGLEYRTNEDSPARVRALVDKVQHITEQPADQRRSEAYRRQYARVLMEQAEALLQHGQLDEAERLVFRASDQNVPYAPTEMTPDDLKRRIADYRRGGRRPDPRRQPDSPGYASASAEPARGTYDQVVAQTREAREALRAGDLDRAEQIAREAQRLGVPDRAFAPNEDRPGLVLLDVYEAKQRDGSVVQAGVDLVIPAMGEQPDRRHADRAYFDPSRDITHNVPASNQNPMSSGRPREFPGGQTPTPAARPQDVDATPIPRSGPGEQLIEQGEAALRAHEPGRALELFRQAYTYRNQLDPMTVQRLQERLELLSNAGPTARPPATMPDDDVAARQRVLAHQILTDLAHQETSAEAMKEKNPDGALAMLQEARANVEQSALETNTKQRLMARVDRRMAEIRRYMDEHQPLIDMEQKNERIRDDMDREQHIRLEVQDKVALMVDEFNKLRDEERYAEAEVVAKRAAELDPHNPVVQQMLEFSKFVRRHASNMALRANKEEGFWSQLDSVDASSVGFDDREPIRFPENWGDISRSRERFAGDRRPHRSERELEIEQKLRTPVMLNFRDAPLSTVLEHLANLAQVNLHLDPQGMAEEAVSSDTPVTIQLSQEISLRSALNLILQPLHLSYVIKDEVLKITSEQMRDGEVFTATYDVADLVIPIPNFVPGKMGMRSALHDAYGDLGYGGMGSPWGGNSGALAVMASNDGRANAGAINPAVLAQLGNSPAGGGGGGLTGVGNPMGGGFGPGGLGGGAQADFDSLIDLVTSTVKPQTWDEVGGPGSIAPFETNLSIVVSQTQDVHEEIVDLLEQLRRLQDLQVTIEVRFITLNDNFFERIGVDFDFNIDSKLDAPEPPDDPDEPFDPLEGIDKSVVVGMQAPGVFSADLDIPFQSNSFGLAVPQFGGFDAAAGAQMGFAILSDIEAFFFINAAQGDRRSNVLQAPKVTLFNGQQAFVSDTSQSPFVISVIPVVGDFAAAQQPVIVVLSEGTFMTVQAVVSKDRRFVRLTVVPFFSQISDDVRTFQFEGTETTNVDRSGTGWVNPEDPDDWRRTEDEEQATRTRSGTTVQLPTFSFVTVTTTVSVPDGGTVLLGGIKRLSEGRNEFGVPMLNKLPYVSRLFKNVGIGRETQSLMMMVTPRIIIQEEEEERLGIMP